MKQFKQPSGEFTIYDPGYPRVKADVSTPARKSAVALEEKIRNDSLETGVFFTDDGTLGACRTQALRAKQAGETVHF